MLPSASSAITVTFLLNFILCSSACTSSSSSSSSSSRPRPPSTTDNDVGQTLPDLFTYDSVSSNRQQRLCPPKPSAATTTNASYPYRSCKVVSVDLSALKAAKMRFSLDEEDPEAHFLVMKKVDEQGMEFLDDAKAKGSTIVDYKSDIGFVSFIVKKGKIFGTVKAPSYGRFHLTVCPGDEDCQLLIIRNLDEKTESET